MTRKADHYDKHYFDKWYRDPAHRIITPAATRRKAAMVVAIAEYYLDRPIRTVLDIGCGEGQWLPVLQRMRPGISYTGIDSSEYAVRRFGKSRNIRLGAFAELAELDLAPGYDLILCANLLYYVPAADLKRGLPALVSRMGGIAYLEAYATTDEVEGDWKEIECRTSAFYRRLFERHGLVSCGPHCYAAEVLEDCVADLERGGTQPKKRGKRNA